jgi:hypothetical protein
MSPDRTRALTDEWSKQYGCTATAMQAPKGRGSTVLFILDLSTRWGEWSASRPGRVLSQYRKNCQHWHWHPQAFRFTRQRQDSTTAHVTLLAVLHRRAQVHTLKNNRGCPERCWGLQALLAVSWTWVMQSAFITSEINAKVGWRTNILTADSG